MKTLTFAVCAAAMASFVITTLPAEARKRHRSGSTIGLKQNNTGGRPGRVISRGPTGADTVTNNSAAGGNALQPSRRVSGGSAGGGTGGGN